MKTVRFLMFAGLAILLLVAVGCRQDEPTATPIPAATDVPPSPTATTPPPTPTETPPEPTVALTKLTPTASPLAGTEWKWLTFTGDDGSNQTPADPNNYTIAFKDDGTIAVQADCNSGFGSYATDDQFIIITDLGMSLTMCLGDSLSDRFVLLLNQAEQYDMAGESLTLTGEAGVLSLTSEEVTVEPPVTNPLFGATWNWLDLRSDDGSTTAAPDPNLYTLLFHDDGNVDIQADCNSGFGEYSVDRQSLAIEVQAMGRAECEADSLSGDFSAWLDQIVAYVIDGDLLSLNLTADAGTLQFTRAEVSLPAANDGSLAPDAVAIDLQGIATFFEWLIVEPTPYDASQPGIPTGLPRHLVLTFDGDPPSSNRQMMLIPADAYRQLWLQAGNPFIADEMDHLKSNIATATSGPPLPIFPPIAGANDLAVQVTTLSLAQGQGIRFIGRTSQDPVPVLSDSLNYYFQGFISIDGAEHLVSLVFPLQTNMLPATADGLTPEQHDLLNNDYPAYLAQVSQLLELAAPADFEPALFRLDAMVASLQVSPQGTGPDSNLALQNIVWQWQSYNDPAAGPTPIDNPEVYTLLFLPDGQIHVLADCNQASGIYNINDQQIGIVIGVVTQAECQEGSVSQQFLSLLDAAAIFFEQNGDLFIDLKFDSGTMRFSPYFIVEPGSPPPQAPAGDGAGLPPDLIQMYLGNLAESYQWQLVPGSVYDNSQPSGPSGAPAHFLVTFDGDDPAAAQRRMYIFPTQAYVDLWNTAGDPTIQDSTDHLAIILAAQPAELPPMILLPSQAGTTDLAAQVGYLTFDAGRGSGLRFVGRPGQGATPVSNDQLYYYFQGLTEDGQFFVSLFWPVAASGFPNSPADVSPEDQALLVADLNSYLAQIVAALNAIPITEWQPPLEQLDGLIGSLVLRP